MREPTVITVFDALTEAISRSAVYNKDDVVPPAAVLWTDEKREFERLLPRLRLAMPNLMTLGPYDPATRTGPAIWLRCALAGKVTALSLPTAAVPVLYLPGVSRPTLRATDECPPEFRPLAELQYRGVFWSQNNGKDWTVSAFLQAEKGRLGLRIARDAATQEAVRRAVEKLMDVPVADLASKSAVVPLDSHDFDDLLVEDPVDDLLSWIASPEGFRARWGAEPGRWEALRSRCKVHYGFDPEKDGELTGAELLGLHAKPVWKGAWTRFATSPARYPVSSLTSSAGRNPRPRGATCWRASPSSPGPRTTTPRKQPSGRRSLTLRGTPSPRPGNACATSTTPTRGGGIGPGRGSDGHPWRTPSGTSRPSPRPPTPL